MLDQHNISRTNSSLLSLRIQKTAKSFTRLARLLLAASGGLALLALLQLVTLAAAHTHRVSAAPPARPLIDTIIGTSMVQHTTGTEHKMTVFGNGEITNWYLNDNGRNQIDQDGKNAKATTIGIRFDQHPFDVVDVGSDNDFNNTTLITLNDSSTIGDFSEDSCVVYASDSPEYQVTQRTFTSDAPANWVVMELAIRNTGDEDLSGGKLLFMVDIDVAYYDQGDDGRYNERRQLVYQADEHQDVGYAMGISLLEGELRGYGVEEVSYLTTDFQKMHEMTYPTNPRIEGSKNAVSWLVSDIPDLDPGEETKLAFGLCAKTGLSQDEAGDALLDCIDDIDEDIYPPSGHIPPCGSDDKIRSVFLPMVLKGSGGFCRPFFDDFAHSGSGWQTLDNEYAEIYYCNGEYCIRNKVVELRVVQAPTSDYSQYAVEVDARWDSEHLGDEYGLIFGQTTFPVPAYRFAVDPVNQEYRLKYHNGHDWQCVNGLDPCWTESPFVNRKSASNRLKAVCNGKNITLYVNDQFVWQGDGPTYCGGRVGVSAQAYPDSDALAHFDNFSVSCLPGATSISAQASEILPPPMSAGLDVDE